MQIDRERIFRVGFSSFSSVTVFKKTQKQTWISKMPYIKLQSSDGEIFEVDVEAAKTSAILGPMAEDLGMGKDDDEPVQLPYVNAAILAKVIKWAEKHKDDPPPPDDDENKEKRTDDIDPWDQEFLKVDQGTLFELIIAANYLDIEGLLDVAFKTAANMIKGGKSTASFEQTAETGMLSNAGKDTEVVETVLPLKGTEEEGVVEPEEETEVEDNTYCNESSVIKREIVTREGTRWAIKLGAVNLIFHPNAVSEPTSIAVYRWKSSVCSPSLQEHEALVSNVIELSSHDGQRLKFSAMVTLSLSHSAPDLRGYEVVIKRQINKETNEWEDVSGTKNLRCRQDIKDERPSHKDVPDLLFPVAQADINECSTYAVVCRLKSSPPYTITSTGGLFIHPDYPGVTVTIPENAVAPESPFTLELKVQEVPNKEFEEEGVFLGPILRIKCFEVVQFFRPVFIQLPVSLRDRQDFNPDPTKCHVRVLFLNCEEEKQEWTELTDLVKPAQFDGSFVRIQVQRFSGYSYLLDWRPENSSVESLGIIRYICYLTRFIWKPPRRASFVAYFRPDIPNILRLICCHSHLTKAVIHDLQGKKVTYADGSSRHDMIPGEDKAYVFVSGGICPFDDQDVNDVFLRLSEDEFKTELRVLVLKDEDLAEVEFHNTSIPTGRTSLLCKFHLSIQNIPRAELHSAFSGIPQSHAQPSILKVSLLADEWGSSKGGLSTINRTLAIHLAKLPNVEVTIIVPQFECGEDDKRAAKAHNISIMEVHRRPGFSDPLDWLSFPPRDLDIQVVIGHGAKLGKQAQIIQESHCCKWVQVVHTEPEELAMYKNYPGAITKGEGKNRAEVELCQLADLVVAVGPKLREAFSSYLRSSHHDVFQLMPGTFKEFSDVEHATRASAKFKVLTFGRGDFEDFSLKGYDIAAQAIVEMKDSSYRLIFVGAPDGKQDEVAEILYQTGISRNQLFVRSFVKDKQRLKDLFCEVDVAIMPSRAEGFGLTALEAMSAGLPILVSGNSGFGEALRCLPMGESFVIDSDDPKEWAKAIATIHQKSRAKRLEEIQRLRRSYEERFSWERQCKSLVDTMWKMVYGKKSNSYPK
ncbi:unnamed protein product [Porites lobata]|uniref:ZU5 domain-containing protein n=1 Tax=Porites lobata TaxID=104759 RepID=A0ABN8S8J7_9CNID|nr:unnamed protein product [Porites lobata]